MPDRAQYRAQVDSRGKECRIVTLVHTHSLSFVPGLRLDDNLTGATRGEILGCFAIANHGYPGACHETAMRLDFQTRYVQVCEGAIKSTMFDPRATEELSEGTYAIRVL